MRITSVVSVLHLSEAAKMLSSDESGGSGHWSMSTLLKSTSIPLVPLEKNEQTVSGHKQFWKQRKNGITSEITAGKLDL
jgi:hypothetical protein